MPNALVAQWTEHLVSTEGVGGSNPSRSTMNKNTIKQLQKQGVKFKTAKHSAFNTLDFLVNTKLANSKNEAKRLIEQGGITINGEKIDKDSPIIAVTPGDIIKRGKFIFLEIKSSKNGWIEFGRKQIKKGIINDPIG